jgi:hypothetical protein
MNNIIDNIIKDIKKLKDIEKYKEEIDDRLKFKQELFEESYKSIIVNLDNLQDMYIDLRENNIERQMEIANLLKLNIDSIRDCNEREELFEEIIDSGELSSDIINSYSQEVKKIEKNRKIIHDIFNFTPILSPKIINSLLIKEEKNMSLLKDNNFILNKINKSLEAAESIMELNNNLN